MLALGNMLRWIEGVYTTPMASVKINGILLEPFPISNSTQQGCPLSPHLSALTLEPLLCRVRWNTDITGLQVGSTHCKVSAYVGDLLSRWQTPLSHCLIFSASLKYMSSCPTWKLTLQNQKRWALPCLLFMWPICNGILNLNGPQRP